MPETEIQAFLKSFKQDLSKYLHSKVGETYSDNLVKETQIFIINKLKGTKNESKF